MPNSHSSLTTPQPIQLQREFTQVPVTALCFHRGDENQQFLFAGEDTDLLVYEVLSQRVVAKKRIFDEQPIHGVHVLGGRVLVWGAREVSFFGLDVLFGEGEREGVAVRGKAADWIYDAVISPYDSHTAVLATAHNEILQLRQSPSTGSLTFGPIISPSRPILYSANTKWLTADTILVAGGTIFGEIFIWKCHLSSSKHEMLHVLTGHQGSIYGVHLSDELSIGGRKVRLLASCSDDRTVRVFDITEGKAEREDRDQKQQRLELVRETGFGVEAEEAAASWGADRTVAYEMGHASRIWGVKFAFPPREISEGDGIVLYSFGEDSTTQKWRLDITTVSESAQSGKTTLSGRITKRETFSLNNGKHLWSHALAQQDSEILIATGGADGQISLILEPSPSPTTKGKPQESYELLNLVLKDALATIPSSRSLMGNKEAFTRYDFIGPDQILAASTHGRILLGRYDPQLSWRELDVEESITADLKLRYVLRRIGANTALLGTTSGNLYHYSEERGLVHIGSVPGKIVHIFNLMESKAIDGQSMNVSVHIHGEAEAFFFTLNSQTGAVEEQVDIKGLDGRFVATAASQVGNQLLAIGSRHGFLSLLRRGQDGYTSILDIMTRSRDAITDIVPLPPKSGVVDSPYFLATSRDGKYRIYKIQGNETDFSLVLQHETSPPLGPMIEGAWFTDDATPELVLHGFKSKNFIVWNESRREEIVSFDCGGGHRTYTLTRHATDHRSLRFAYTKASRLYMYSQDRLASRSLKRGIHGREIRALTSNGRLIATGAEDTSIRIWDYRETQLGGENRELHCVAYIKLHITGIQQLKWLGEDYLFSSAGNEEFFVWRISRLDAGYTGLGVVCEAVFGDKSRDSDLRIMDFDIQEIGSDGKLIVSMILSNSSLKTYQYSQKDGFRLLAKSSYTGACLSQIRHLKLHGDGVSILTASTDGHLATWEVKWEATSSEIIKTEKTSNHLLVQVTPIHQNCIKSLDLQATPEGYLVLTGGDDNGLGVTSVTPLPSDAGPGGRGYTVSSRGIMRRAHAAAVNGVLLLSREGETLAVSASNDQRVKLWKIGVNKFQLIKDEYSGVADPGDIELIDGKAKVMVGGVGVEVWTIE